MLRLSSLSAWIKIGWYEQKESVGTYLLPVPRFEAFALPSTVERDNVEAHADMIRHPLMAHLL